MIYHKSDELTCNLKVIIWLEKKLNSSLPFSDKQLLNVACPQESLSAQTTCLSPYPFALASENELADLHWGTVRLKLSYSVLKH